MHVGMQLLDVCLLHHADLYINSALTTLLRIITLKVMGTRVEPTCILGKTLGRMHVWLIHTLVLLQQCNVP